MNRSSLFQKIYTEPLFFRAYGICRVIVWLSIKIQSKVALEISSWKHQSCISGWPKHTLSKNIYRYLFVYHSKVLNKRISLVSCWSYKRLIYPNFGMKVHSSTFMSCARCSKNIRFVMSSIEIFLCIEFLTNHWHDQILTNS